MGSLKRRNSSPSSTPNVRSPAVTGGAVANAALLNRVPRGAVFDTETPTLDAMFSAGGVNETGLPGGAQPNGGTGSGPTSNAHRIDVSAKQVDFGQLTIGSSDSESVFLFNNGRDDVIVDQITQADGNLPEGVSVDGFMSNTLMNAGSTEEIHVAARPDLPGAFGGRLHVLEAGGGSTATIDVRGVGVVPDLVPPSTGEGGSCSGCHPDPHPGPEAPAPTRATDWRTAGSATSPKTLQTVKLVPGPVPPKRFIPKKDRTSDYDAHRQRGWAVFRSDCLKVQNAWNRVVPGLQAYRAAHADPALVGSRMVKPAKDWKGDLGELANQQKLVGGRTVGGLFQGNALAMSKEGQSALATASGEEGRSKTVDVFRVVSQAEHLARARYSDLKKAVSQLDAAKHGVAAATHRIEYQQASEAEAAAKVELEALKKKAKNVASTIMLVSKVKDAIEKPGATGTAFWGYAMRVAGSDEFKAIEARLQAAQRQKKTARWGALESELSKANADMSSANHACTTKQEDLRASLVGRMRAYDRAGARSAAVAGGGAGGDELHAILTAIPHAETMVARLNVLHGAFPAQVDFPTYTKDSGIGYQVGLEAGDWAAMDFAKVRGWLVGSRREVTADRSDWTARLAALRNVKTELEGPMAGGND